MCILSSWQHGSLSLTRELIRVGEIAWYAWVEVKTMVLNYSKLQTNSKHVIIAIWNMSRLRVKI